MTTPLLVTRDTALIDELLRLAAAAGVTPQLVDDPVRALSGWAAAPLVCVGTDVAAELAALQPQRRDAAYVVALGPVGHDVFVSALDLGAQAVVELPRSEAWLVEVLTDVGDSAPAPGVLIGVVGGSGGSGASTLACGIAQVAARRGPALVVDADPLGPGLDLLLGLDGRDGVRWEALEQTTGRLSARSLRDAVPRRDGLGVLTWAVGQRRSLQAFAVRAALSAAQRGHQHVVLDLPRETDPLVDEMAARCDLLLVLTRPSLTGVAAASQVVERLRDATRLRLVVRGEGVAVREIESLTGLPDALPMPSQRGLDEAIDLGTGPVRTRRGPLYRTAVQVLESVHARGVAA